MARGRVWRRLVVSALAVVCCAGGSACGDGDDTEGCVVEPESNKAESPGKLVYSVSGTTLATVFKVVYSTPDGEKTVDNPTLPFSATVQLEKGDSMHIEVTGTADEGASISAGYTFAGTTANDGVAVSATCQR